MKILIILLLLATTAFAVDDIDPYVYIWQNPATNDTVVIIPDEVETLDSDGLFFPDPNFVDDVILLDGVVPTVSLDSNLNPILD